jgi:hypothetical protein
MEKYIVLEKVTFNTLLDDELENAEVKAPT